ncbi:hypothetical protein GCM10010191_49740 [Actinomadura vinacea]|uniref:Uncharacterized protein n=1 Tax=Actinomadura vinacea TaxID=115336 RepID=A0ABN3JHD3_9ACTN
MTGGTTAAASAPPVAASERRPTIVMIVNDDHTAHAISAYGSVVDRTPRIDEIGARGARPATFHDDDATRTTSARRAAMRIAEHLNEEDLKESPPEGLSHEEEAPWKYQRYMQDYLRRVASVPRPAAAGTEHPHHVAAD